MFSNRLLKPYLFLKNKINLFALAFCGLCIGIWMVLLARAYYFAKLPGLIDLTHFSHVLWKISHGSLNSSVMGCNFLTDHEYLLSFLLVPFYQLYPSPLLLIYLKIGAFFIGAYIFFLILKKDLHPLIAFGAMAAFTVTPANINMLEFPFNYEPFSIPLFFLIFKSFNDKHYFWYMFYCFILILLEEQMSLVVIMFGVFAFFFRKEDKLKWAIVPVVLGLIAFIIELFILIPHVRRDLIPHQSLHWARYSQFGTTPLQIVLSLLTHPVEVFKQLFNRHNIAWYKDLFGTWGWLSFLSPHILLPGLPLFLKTLLSRFWPEHNVYWAYYASTFTPFIFLAAWNTLNGIKNKSRLYIHGLVIILMFAHTCTIPVIKRLFIFGKPSITSEKTIMHRFINKIPPDASVLSSYQSGPFLSNRQELYPVMNFLVGRYYVSWLPFKLPEKTDYLLIDLNEFSRNKRRTITALNFDRRWRLEESMEDQALYVRNISKERFERLIDKRWKPFLNNTAYPVRFNKTVVLKDMDFYQEFPKEYRIFPITMYWKCLSKTNSSDELLIKITSNGKVYYEKHRTIGSTIYPTDFWKKGEYIKEKYFYLLPRLEPGEYSVDIYGYDSREKQWKVKIRKSFHVQ